MAAPDTPSNDPVVTSEAPATGEGKRRKPQHAAFLVHEARFVLSAPNLSILPEPEFPEIAFIGRSNVGKSSLLNRMLSRRRLAHVSKTPGRTRALNVFQVEVTRRAEGEDDVRRTYRVVDLPGYGYAKLSHKERAALSRVISQYLSRREGLAAVAQLFDLRHKPSAADRLLVDQLVDASYTVVPVGTKSDKLSKNQRARARAALAKSISRLTSHVVPFSSETLEGREQLWQRMWDAPYAVRTATSDT